jgi:predicted kinase
MPTPPSNRSVKIPSDERGGWSSDRPRRDGAPPRPPDISVRCRVLSPSEELRYSPGSLVVLVSGSTTERDRFTGRLIRDRASLMSLDKVRGLLAGRVAEEDVEPRAAELLDAAVLKRLQASETVVLAAEGLAAEGRERFVRMAAGLQRPRHLILLETARDQVREDERATLNELRRALDAGELGAEGFQTALRLGGTSASEVKRLVFRSLSRDE